MYFMRLVLWYMAR